MKKHFIKYVALFIFASAMTACAPKVAKTPSGCSVENLTFLQTQIEGANGQFVELGDQVIIDLPTQMMFVANSKNLTPLGAILLERVAKRVQCYTTQSVSIKVYTGTLSCGSVNRSLADQRAGLVANVLRYYHVSRLVYDEGVSIVNSNAGCWLNRVEITTTQLGRKLGA